MIEAISAAMLAMGLAATPQATDAEIATKKQSTTNASAEIPKIVIYHLEGRRSERIIWLMEELDLPYELKFVRGNLMASMMQIRALGHGMPMAPTVVYGDDIIVESGAIIDTILARHAPGKLVPPLSSRAYPHHVKWMHYAEGSLAARLFSDYRAWRVKPPTKRSMLVDSENVVQYSEDYLKENKWFGGSEFSAADIMMEWPLNVAFKLNLVNADQFPNIQEWQKRIKARPAYMRMRSIATPDGIIGALPPVKHPPSDSRATTLPSAGSSN
ncbi:MAG: glutathione binding-like protein [Parasphingorhabdus sp.]|uniref:glutathione S-transferase family protein n=1 Tax=Parasphingorhabdus sp. TaxID=2709688 RepID=UPI003297198F